MSITSQQPSLSSIDDRLLIDDDTEESVSGSDFHLAAILALYEVVRLYAQRTAKRWYVTAEVLILTDLPDRTPSRNPWRVMPDVYVVRDLDGHPRTSLDARSEGGFPQFICEVASESTSQRDLGEKQRVYADLGVWEYVVFDPNGLHLGQQVQAWRRSDEGWGLWVADAEGFLHSAALDGLRLRAENTLLRVYDPEGNRLPIMQELDQLARAQAVELERERTERERERARLLELEATLARLQGHDQPD